MKRTLSITLSLVTLFATLTLEPAWGRGFGGFHGGGPAGGFGGGPHGPGGAGFGGPGGLGGGGFGGGLGAGGLGPAGPGAGGLGAGGLGPGGLGGSNLRGQLGNAELSGLGQDLGAGRFGGEGALGGPGAGGLSAGGLGGGALAGRDGALGGLDAGAAPSRSQLSSFLGLPSDNGLHNLSGQTQSPLSQAVDNARAGDGPGQNFIHGETQSNLSKLYDNYQAGNHAFQPVSPWIANNNAVVIRNNFNNYNIYTSDWYRRYPGAWYPRAWAYGNPWVYAPWGTLWVWMGLASAEPNYYDYGTTIVTQGDSVYDDGQDMGTTAQYYQQAQTLAQAGAGGQAADSQEWMPLGVFAVSNGQQTAATNVIQLAVNKQGTLRGNYTNTATNQTQVVQGSVDKQTQRAAWTIGDDTQTVYETGIYNLTMDHTPVIVHLGSGKTEQWSLVRIDQQGGQPAGDQTAPVEE